MLPVNIKLGIPSNVKEFYGTQTISRKSMKNINYLGFPCIIQIQIGNV